MLNHKVRDLYQPMQSYSFARRIGNTGGSGAVSRIVLYQRTAMFIIISDTDDTFNFLVAIMYTQLFNLLCDRADDVHGGRLPYHVRLLLDEFSSALVNAELICSAGLVCNLSLAR